MGKYFAVFVVQLIILARCVASLQSEEISEKTIDELQSYLDDYDKLIGENEDKLKKLEWEWELEIKNFDFNEEKTNVNNQFTDLQNQLTECQNNQTKKQSIIRNFLIKFMKLIDDKAKEIQNLQSNITDADSKLRECSDICKINVEIFNLKSAQRQMEEQITKLNIKVHSNENQHRDFQDRSSEIEPLTQKISKMESQLKQTENTIQSLIVKTQSNLPESCAWRDGIQFIQVAGANPFEVLCNNVVFGVGWLIIQQRIDGKVAFNRNWADYKKGFGDFHSDFFLGLEKLHRITNAQPHELFIRLTDPNNVQFFAHYDHFKIGNEANGYSLEVLENYTGNAGDAMTENKFQTFKTDDHGNSYQNYCPNGYSGGWWFPSYSCGRR